MGAYYRRPRPRGQGRGLTASGRPRMSRELVRLRGRLGAAAKAMQRHPTELEAHRSYVAALRNYHARAVEEQIRYVVELVPLTDEQTSRLAALLARGQTGAS